MTTRKDRTTSAVRDAVTIVNQLALFSESIEARVRQGAHLVAGVRGGSAPLLSAIQWQPGLLLTSEQSLTDAGPFVAVLPGGACRPAALVGRDAATNTALLRFEVDDLRVSQDPPQTAAPRGPGGIVIAIGSDGQGGVTAHVGHLERCGPAWESRSGGHIDSMLRLGLGLQPEAEGGPVIDASGALLGMSTFGPRQSVLAIPTQTIERVISHLLAHGQVARGWIGAALHRVALPPELAAHSATGAGLMVLGLAGGAPAASILVPGDILLEMSGRAITTPRDVAAALGVESVGRVARLKFLRGGALTTADVMIGAKP